MGMLIVAHHTGQKSEDAYWGCNSGKALVKMNQCWVVFCPVVNWHCTSPPPAIKSPARCVHHCSKT